MKDTESTHSSLNVIYYFLWKVLVIFITFVNIVIDTLFQMLLFLLQCTIQEKTEKYLIQLSTIVQLGNEDNKFIFIITAFAIFSFQ